MIGDDEVEYCMENTLKVLQTTKLYNEINTYPFASTVEVEIILEQILYFQGANVDDGEEMSEPTRKKRQENEVPHTFKIVLDGHSVEPQGMLCFINDCRQNLEVLNLTVDAVSSGMAADIWCRHKGY